MSEETNGSSWQQDLENDEIWRLGNPVYERLRRELGPETEGIFVAIHVDTGEYAVGPSSFDATLAVLHGRKPDGRLYIRRLSDEPDYALVARFLAGEMMARRGNSV